MRHPRPRVAAQLGLRQLCVAGEAGGGCWGGCPPNFHARPALPRLRLRRACSGLPHGGCDCRARPRPPQAARLPIPPPALPPPCCQSWRYNVRPYSPTPPPPARLTHRLGCLFLFVGAARWARPPTSAVHVTALCVPAAGRLSPTFLLPLYFVLAYCLFLCIVCLLLFLGQLVSHLCYLSFFSLGCV